MILLAIDTCTERLIVAVRGKTDRWINVDSGGNHARDLIEVAQSLLGGDRPDVVGVSVGPGSFTGVRIGMAAAKGLSEGWNVPLVALDNLAAMASSWRVLCPSFDGPVLVAIDARKAKFYGGLYHDSQILIPPADLSPADWLAAVRGMTKVPVHVSGYQGALLAAAWGADRPADWVVVPGHDWTLPLLNQTEREWKANRFLPREAGPRYLRMSEAEEERLKRR